MEEWEPQDRLIVRGCLLRLLVLVIAGCLWGLALLLFGGCAQRPTLMELVDAMNARGISHCFVVHAQVAPYGRASLYAKTGDMACETLWQHLITLGE